MAQQTASPQVPATVFATSLNQPTNQNAQQDALACPWEDSKTKTPDTAAIQIEANQSVSQQASVLDATTSAPKEQAPSSLLGAICNKIGSTMRCYLELWKTRLSSLVVLTTAGGYYASGGYQQGTWQEQSALLGGTFLQAACANSLNEIFEVERDAIMARTKNRPLPTNRISKAHATIQAVVCGALGTALLYKYTNGLTASIGAANIFFYAGIYTPMKTRHWLNTWVGTINGSLPPLMGCTAATNTVWHPTGFYMFSSMYLWQISHFMAIAYKCRADYDKAGYQMLSIVSPDDAATQGVLHAALLFPLCWSMGPACFNVTAWWFPMLSTPINYFYLLKPALKFKKQVNYQNATDFFFASLKHLVLLFGLGMVAFWGHKPEETLPADWVSQLGNYVHRKVPVWAQ